MTIPLRVAACVVEDVGVPAPGDARMIESLIGYALEAEARSGDWEITVALVSDDELRRLHREFLGDDTVTDIMTFPLGEEQGGDIAISVDRAAEQAPDYAHSTWEEVCFLTVHGVLHLCGWDDIDDEDRAAMLTRQAEIVTGWLRSQGETSSRR